MHRQCCGHPLECRPRDGVISCWKSTPLCNASRTVLSASWCSGGIFDFDHKQDRLTEVEAELAESNVWDKPEHAQALGRERAELERVVGTILALQRQFADCNELITLAGEDQDESLFTAALRDLDQAVASLEQLEFRRMFAGELDPSNAYLDIQAGSGGTEAQDWAEMLLRMYLKWGDKHGFKADLMEASPGEVAGIKSATVLFQGEYAYGWLRTETGIHRLVRKSPFDSGNRRHTSFASVFVSPEIDDSIQIDLDMSKVRVDTYRASGAGGQHVNKTDSAIRITHLPTGLVVECQDERSQHKNRARAMALLHARLQAAADAERQKELSDARRNLVGSGDRSEKIRTYNYPDGRVTDHRIKLTLYRLGDIMNGDMDNLIQPLLAEYQADQLAEIAS